MASSPATLIEKAEIDLDIDGMELVLTGDFTEEVELYSESDNKITLRLGLPRDVATELRRELIRHGC
jgi:hypothetical protein